MPAPPTVRDVIASTLALVRRVPANQRLAAAIGAALLTALRAAFLTAFAVPLILLLLATKDGQSAFFLHHRSRADAFTNTLIAWGVWMLVAGTWMAIVARQAFWLRVAARDVKVSADETATTPREPLPEMMPLLRLAWAARGPALNAAFVPAAVITIWIAITRGNPPWNLDGKIAAGLLATVPLSAYLARISPWGCMWLTTRPKPGERRWRHHRRVVWRSGFAAPWPVFAPTFVILLVAMLLAIVTGTMFAIPDVMLVSAADSHGSVMLVRIVALVLLAVALSLLDVCAAMMAWAWRQPDLNRTALPAFALAVPAPDSIAKTIADSEATTASEFIPAAIPVARVWLRSILAPVVLAAIATGIIAWAYYMPVPPNADLLARTNAALATLPDSSARPSLPSTPIDEKYSAAIRHPDPDPARCVAAIRDLCRWVREQTATGRIFDYSVAKNEMRAALETRLPDLIAKNRGAMTPADWAAMDAEFAAILADLPTPELPALCDLQAHQRATNFPPDKPFNRLVAASTERLRAVNEQSFFAINEPVIRVFLADAGISNAEFAARYRAAPNRLESPANFWIRWVWRTGPWDTQRTAQWVAECRMLATWLRLARVVCHIEAHHRRTGAWPASLAELSANPWPGPPLDIADDWAPTGAPYSFVPPTPSTLAKYMLQSTGTAGIPGILFFDQPAILVPTTNVPSPPHSQPQSRDNRR